ncbi:MAG: 5-(carboxyamino)imidazole ribonucleotide synthase [Pseudomonadota bacterium]
MTRALSLGSRIGILGGGQLGRMLSVAASRLGYVTHIFDPAEDAPAAHVAAKHIAASYEDLEALRSFAQAVDVVTYEFENVPTDALDAIEAIVQIHPNRRALSTSQDRLTEKEFLKSLDLNVAEFVDITSPLDFGRAETLLSHGAILKTRRFGYDGKGQVRLSAKDSLEQAWSDLNRAPSVLEALVPFTSEISVIGARSSDGQVICYDPGENTHRNGILHETVVPAQITSTQKTNAVLATAKVLNALEYVGVMGVEFFVTANGLLVNEFAPRVHNSGHWTQQGCAVDQFEQHIRAIAGLPLNDARRSSNVTMTNLIGSDIENLAAHLNDASSAIHLYGKAEAKPGRKMGHVNKVTSSA